VLPGEPAVGISVRNLTVRKISLDTVVEIPITEARDIGLQLPKRLVALIAIGQPGRALRIGSG
jgi:hypothetical protein